jgi:predicted DsbA family dithiol-disulfide isomerase
MAEPMTPPLTVAIWSDYVCPFCRIAEERADWLQREAGAEIHWMPYDLHPEYPPQGIPRADLLKRYGENMTGHVKAMAEEAGLSYNPHPTVVPNTRKALELSEWARTLGEDAHDRLHARIMVAYWTEAQDLSDWDVLLACVADVGLDPGEAREAVESGAHREAVDASTAWAQQHGIQAVPAFVLDGRVLVSGAQPHSQFEQAIQTVQRLRAEAAAG